MSCLLFIADLERRSIPADLLARAAAAEARAPSAASVVEARGAIGGAFYVPAPGLDAPPGLSLSADVRLDARDDLVRALGLERAPRAPRDEDLLLHGYARWGPDLLERITGDFAFALHDAREDRVLLATDLLAARPLCHALHAGRIVAASSARALVRAGLVPADQDEERVLQALVPLLEANGAHRTPYRHVTRLLPGERLVWHHGRGPVGGRAPLILDASEAPGDVEVHRLELRRQLEIAVAERLTPEGGIMLSGGIDSCAVAGVARALRRRTGGVLVATFSVLHDDPALCPEGEALRALESQGGLRPTHGRPSEIATVEADVLAWVERLEDPFDALIGLVPVTSMLMARRAGVPVLMTGVDGDLATSLGSNLSGYALAHGRLGLAFEMARGAGRHQRRGAAGIFWREGVKLLAPRRARACWRWLARSEPRWIQRAVQQSGLGPDLVRQLDLPGRLREVRRRYWPDVGVAGRAPQERHLARLASGFLQAALARYERVAAQLGVELRHPLAATGLLRACVRMPWWAKDVRGVTKGLLRASLEDELPPQVRERLASVTNMASPLMTAWLARPAVRQAFAQALTAPGFAGCLRPETMGQLQAGFAPPPVPPLSAWAVARARAQG